MGNTPFSSNTGNSPDRGVLGHKSGPGHIDLVAHLFYPGQGIGAVAVLDDPGTGTVWLVADNPELVKESLSDAWVDDASGSRLAQEMLENPRGEGWWFCAQLTVGWHQQRCSLSQFSISLSGGGMAWFILSALNPERSLSPDWEARPVPVIHCFRPSRRARWCIAQPSSRSQSMSPLVEEAVVSDRKPAPNLVPFDSGLGYSIGWRSWPRNHSADPR
jgi:hypothetical protein